MGSVQQAADTYRLIVTRRNAAEILLLPARHGWVLPQVEIERHQRLAEQLNSEVATAWGVETYLLFVSRDVSSDGSREPAYAVMESVKQNSPPPQEMCWMPSASVAEYCDPSDAIAVKNALVETQAYTAGEKSGPFARPGWMRELCAWTNTQIAPLGLRLTGWFKQLNASPTFALIRLETEAGAVWFKAAGEPNAHELRVTVQLARLFPQCVPPILGIHRDWNGWLSPEAPGMPLDETTESSAWERVATNLAKLQIESIERTKELLQSQLKDLRPAKLMERVDPFVARMIELMAAQEKVNPAPLSPPELANLAVALGESCAILESIGLPATLAHTDFNPGNIIVSNDGCMFLDWAEGCVTYPLLTFEYLRVHLERCGLGQPATTERLLAAYLQPWTTFYSHEVLSRALAFAPLIAVFAFAVSTDAWQTLDPACNPALAGYFRSLTRRMHRESVQVVERSESCRS